MYLVDAIIVDDDSDMRDSLVSALNRAGLATVEAADGESVLPLIRADDPPRVLVTDIHLGLGMDGWALGAAVRRMCPEIPIVYISGRAVGGRLGARERFLPKPFTGAALLSLIREIG